MTSEERRDRRAFYGGCRGSRTPENLGEIGRLTGRRAALVEAARRLFAPECQAATQ